MPEVEALPTKAHASTTCYHGNEGGAGTFFSTSLLCTPLSPSLHLSSHKHREGAEARMKVASKPLCANNLPIKLSHPSFTSPIPLFACFFHHRHSLPLLSSKRMPSQEGSGEGSLWRGPSRTHSIRVQGHRHYRAPFLSLQWKIDTHASHTSAASLPTSDRGLDKHVQGKRTRKHDVS